MKRRFLVIGGLCSIGSNTYHVAKIYDCEKDFFYYTRLSYGYDTQYIETAKEYIRNNITKDGFIVVDGGSYQVKRSKLENQSF